MKNISKVPDQNGIYRLYNMLEIYHSGLESLMCDSYLQKLCVDLDGTWHAVKTCWSDESHTPFLLSDQYSRERIQVR